MHTRPVTLLDLVEHPVDICGGKVHACRRSNDFKLGRNLAAGLAPAGLDERLPYPFRNDMRRKRAAR